MIVRLRVKQQWVDSFTWGLWHQINKLGFLGWNLTFVWLSETSKNHVEQPNPLLVVQQIFWIKGCPFKVVLNLLVLSFIYVKHGVFICVVWLSNKRFSMPSNESYLLQYDRLIDWITWMSSSCCCVCLQELITTVYITAKPANLVFLFSVLST